MATIMVPDELLLGNYATVRDHVLAELQVAYFNALIARTGGNMTKAARLGGITRRTLYRLKAVAEAVGKSLLTA